LGDLDLATHLLRTSLLGGGHGLAEVTRELCARFGVAARLLPMTEDPAPTGVRIADGNGQSLHIHFQEYWVERRGADEVEAIRYGATAAKPGPGVLEAISTANAIVLPPSNPVASIGPILAVPGIRDAVLARRDRVVGVSGIVGGAPLAGMADRLLPAIGVEVSAAGVAEHYRELLAAWVIDRADQALAPRIEAMGIGVGVTDTIMANDLRAEALARYALSLL
jgi:LPPG:FO 2-phospho-L-lactate transferase